MAVLTVRFDLTFGPRALRGALAAGMVLAAAPELASESVTLSTYYPAPSGVYAQLITTGNTFLARDTASNGQKVGVGTGTPQSLLSVNGSAAVGTYAPSNAAPANGLIVSGKVGLGTPSPLNALDVRGGAAFGNYGGANSAGAGLIVSGNVGIGTPSPSVSLQVNGGTARFGGQAIGYVDIYNVVGGLEGGEIHLIGNNGMGAYLEAYGSVLRGINSSRTAETFRVDNAGDGTFYGDLRANGNVTATSANCYSINMPPNGSQNGAGCPSGSHYITTIGGIYAPYMSLPFADYATSGPNATDAGVNTIDALCCSCPVSTGCNL